MTIDFSLEGVDGTESVTISFWFSLFNQYGFSDDAMKEENSVLNKKAKRFLSLEEKILSEELDIDNPRQIWNNDDLEWSGSRKEQLQLYDYYLSV